MESSFLYWVESWVRPVSLNLSSPKVLLSFSSLALDSIKQERVEGRN